MPEEAYLEQASFLRHADRPFPPPMRLKVVGDRGVADLGGKRSEVQGTFRRLSRQALALWSACS